MTQAGAPPLGGAQDAVPIARPSASAIVRGCDIERCPHPNDARQAWNGKWPGEDDCERSGFYSNGDPDFPDLNRLFTDFGMPTHSVGNENSERAVYRAK